MVLAICLTVSAEASENLSVETLKERIKTILTTLQYDLTSQNKFCQTFFTVFQAQKEISYISPLVQTDDYQAPDLQRYLSRCPKLDLNKVLTLEARFAEEVEALPAEEQDQHGDVHRGTRNFRLYRADINNNRADGEEYVFYHEKFLHASHLGQPLDPQDGEEYDERGAYRVVDLQRCKIVGSIPTNELGNMATVPDYHGVIAYKQRHYIVDVYPLGGGQESYALQAWGHDVHRGRIIPLCTISPVLSKRGQAK
jgi:hypothetical protein